MLNNILRNVWGNVKNIPGWRTKRKILVIEADDYGSLRMPSRRVFEELVNMDFITEGYHDKYDSIETAEDLELLFKVLKKHRGHHGKYASFTPFFNPANPDLDAIINNKFSSYEYLTYAELLKKNGIPDQIHDLWREGIEKGFCKPQYHGREHVNVPVFMRLLQNGNNELIESIKMGFFHPKLKRYGKYKSLRPGLYFENEEDKEYLKLSIADGAKLFKKYFDYSATVFCPSNGVFHDDFKPVLTQSGIQTLVESGIRFYPDGRGGVTSKRKFIFGEKDSSYSLINYCRNVVFEPTRDGTAKSVKNAFEEIKKAFRWGKPAVIATHRTNFSGRLHPENREKSLHALDELLASVTNAWPEIEFMNSGEVSDLVHATQKKIKK